MTPKQFLGKCLKSSELKETIRKTSTHSSLWACIHSCIDDIENDEGDINQVAEYLGEWMKDMEEYKSIDELLDYCSPEFNKKLEEA